MEPTASPRLGRRLLAFALLFAVTACVAAFVWFQPRAALLILLLSPLYTFPFMIGLFPGIWRRRGEGLPAAAADLERRRPVWNALSDLYLDTELDDRDHERIAAVLVDSGYSTGQLEEILYRELHPVLHINLLDLAGEWSGFDPDWLEKRILQRRPHRSRFAIIPGTWMVRSEWAALQAKLWRGGSRSLDDGLAEKRSSGR